MTLPAGIMPTDSNIELFGHPEKFGKCLFVQMGHTQGYDKLPGLFKEMLSDELDENKKAKRGLKLMGIPKNDWVEQYNYCNRGRLDGIPDIATNGKITFEYVNCGRRGQCPGEGLVCKPLHINGKKITDRERECLELLSKGETDKQIKSEMGFKSLSPVNSLMERLRNKLNVNRRSEMAIIAKEIGF